LVNQRSRQLWLREPSGTNSKESPSSRIKIRFSRAWLIESHGHHSTHLSFYPLLDQSYAQERKRNAGRKRIDPLILFKMLVLQQLFTLSGAELECQVNDRRSLEEFARLAVMKIIQDATTGASFRERL
jgi:hypothetical protein